MIIKSYAAAGIAIGSSAAVDGGITIGTTAQYTFTVPVPSAGPTLPSWLTHAWEADTLTLADGDPVASWVDSISAAELTQTTPSLRPTYRTGPAVEFDGTDDVVTGLSAGELNDMLRVATYTIAWCGRWDDYGGGVLAVPIGNTVSSAVRGCSLWLDGRAGQNRIVFAHNAFFTLSQTSTAIANLGDSLYHTVICVANGNTATANIYIDGVEVSSYIARPNLVSNAGAVFPEWRVGSSSGGFPFDGKTNGVYVASNHAATPAEVMELHNYRIARGTL